jgi:hypothetical protein
MGVGIFAAPPGARAQTNEVTQLLHKLDPLLSHSGSQGYLGVLVSDVDNDSASKLKLKQARGALITLIDHDAPAGKSLKVNDVVLDLNGQRIEGAEQFGRLLREIPAGRKITVLISRDGAALSIELQLVDRKVMEHDVWNKLGNGGDGVQAPAAMGMLGGGGDAPLPGFHMPFFNSSLNVGAMVEPLTAQTADYLGIPSGVMIKQVTRKSEAAAAGLKPYDVILKVGGESISTVADWDRAIRANQGKPVAVTILRDRRQQTVNLQVDSKHKSAIDIEDIFPGLLPDGPNPLIAQLEVTIDQKQMADLRQQMEQFRRDFKAQDFTLDPKQINELKKQMQQFGEGFKAEDFKIDPKQMDELKRQMEQFRQSFNANDFKIDRKQMDELKKQMEQFRKALPQQLQMNQQQLQDLKRKFEELNIVGPDQQV